MAEAGFYYAPDLEMEDKAIKNFQDGYKAKAWAKWIALKGLIFSLKIIKTLNEIILNLAKYNEAYKMVGTILDIPSSDIDNYDVDD